MYMCIYVIAHFSFKSNQSGYLISVHFIEEAVSKELKTNSTDGNIIFLTKKD